MSRLGGALAWRWRRLTRPFAEGAGRVRRRWRRIAEAGERAAFRRSLAALRAERARARPQENPRLLAIGAWSFPLASQSFVYQELAALAAAGFDVRLAVSSSASGAPPSPAAESLAARRLHLPGACSVGEEALRLFRTERRGAVDAVVAELARAAGRPAAEIERDPHVLRAFAFAALAEAFGADWLHSYFFYEGALAAFVAQRLLRVPRGLTAYADHCLADYRFKLVREQLESADLVVATSERIRGELLALAPVAAARILVKPNTVDTDFFSPREIAEPIPGEPFRLLSIARFDPKKGLDLLVDAVAELGRREVSVLLDLVGGAEGRDPAAARLERELRDRAERLGVAGRIRFRGLLGAAEVRSALAQAHLFVAPYVETATGDKDGIPTAILEAMASGVPVLATTAGSISEAIVDGTSGRLVAAPDGGAFAAAAADLLRDPALRRRLAAAAVERARSEFAASRREPLLARKIRGLLAGR